MKRVVLLGGGHAHVHVLQSLARERLAGAECVLVTPFARQMYSGMVPGLVAGHYTVDQCAIPLRGLVQSAGVRLVEDAVQGLDAGARTLRLASGETMGYDLLSLDTGSVMDRDRIPGAREHGLFVRPIEHFVRLVDPLLALAQQRVLDVVVVGGGSAGVELAMALQFRLAGQGDEGEVQLKLGVDQERVGEGPRRGTGDGLQLHRKQQLAQHGDRLGARIKLLRFEPD